VGGVVGVVDIPSIIESGVGAYNETAAIFGGGGVEHRSVDEVLPTTPRFASALRRTGEAMVPIQGLVTTPGAFEDAMTAACAPSNVVAGRPIALVFTKTPETVLVVLPPRGVHGEPGPWPLGARNENAREPHPAPATANRRPIPHL